MRALQRKVNSADSTGNAFFDDLRAFRAFGQGPQTFVDGGIACFVNEYWTARQRQSHALHEVSYRACFKAELPRFFHRAPDGAGRSRLRPLHGARHDAARSGVDRPARRRQRRQPAQPPSRPPASRTGAARRGRRAGSPRSTRRAAAADEDATSSSSSTPRPSPRSSRCGATSSNARRPAASMPSTIGSGW